MTSVWPDRGTINRAPISPKRFICHVRVALVWCNTDGVVTAQNDECHVVLLMIFSLPFIFLCYLESLQHA